MLGILVPAFFGGEQPPLLLILSTFPLFLICESLGFSGFQSVTFLCYLQVSVGRCPKMMAFLLLDVVPDKPEKSPTWMRFWKVVTTDSEQTARDIDFQKPHDFGVSCFSGAYDFDGQKTEGICYVKSFSQMESIRGNILIILILSISEAMSDLF